MDKRSEYQFFFEHQGQLIELPPGETMVGRGLSCGIRFNDGSVSRSHLRLVVERDKVTAQDPGSSNGTLINGRLLEGETRLQHGDIVQVGQRLLRLALLADDFGETKTPPLAVPAVGRSYARAVSIHEAPASDLNRFVSHSCPRCGAAVPIETDLCDACSYQWPEPTALSKTQRIDPVVVDERRSQPRVAVSVLLLYSREGLAFEAVARDLSHGGVYVETEFEERVGTVCRLSFLPEGRPAIYMEGRVRRASKLSHQVDPPCYGIGVEFTLVSEGARQWLQSVVPLVTVVDDKPG